ncbi:virulence RhuM family protein [Bartonella krasnovii]|uniref:virulence RhuM family protein n=2 Tax=Bartonella krasnovii TaxID=2267275 RepID=UPI001F4C8AD1|nr:virulence RhuM family protein [Bartonella krasnovii]UNF39158.1 virulence RhuM family protein [Bartonella krasnovii]UNF50699.1 virulence RhuM family protein [Bartonella krasnovii]
MRPAAQSTNTKMHCAGDRSVLIFFLNINIKYKQCKQAWSSPLASCQYCLTANIKFVTFSSKKRVLRRYQMPPKKLIIRNSTAEFLIFTQQAGEEGIEVRYENDTIWLSQKLMAELFSVDVRTISEHLKNIFETQELNENSVIRKIRITASDGKNYNTQFYNLDAIIAVGYRVNSKRATQFRQWATQILRDFAIKGYVIDKKRLENGQTLNEDYFEHLLAEIREIRLSERRFYQKITDIYTTSIDYNKDAPTTREFFKKVQNKLHFAVHGHTAAELIATRADSNKKHMGLVTWENSPHGKIVKTDVTVAKNYLTQDELKQLGLIVSAYLDLAESRAERKMPMTMEDWAKQLDKLLELDERNILQNAGTITTTIAKEYAKTEFEKYRIIQDKSFESDFDKEIKTLEKSRRKKSDN